jgi:membrane protein YdbS with pleckstrin-like domain
MSNRAKVAVGNGGNFRAFGPHPVMKKFLYSISLLIIAVSVLPWSIPVGFYTHEPVIYWIVGIGVHAVTLIVTLLILLWIPRYHKSIGYGIDEEWLYAEGGVVWQRRARLPISRVQMVNIAQGPWQRLHGVASVNIYTAATGQPTAEMTYRNVANAEDIRDRILGLVQQHRADPAGLGDRHPEVGAGVGSALGSADISALSGLLADVLKEVRSIRESLGNT